MIVVLDASAAVEVVLNRKEADHLSTILSQADSVLVPSLYPAEIANVFWKYHQHCDMPISDCENYLQATLEIPDEQIDIKNMTNEVFSTAIRTNMTAYDMYYMVLARRHNAYLMSLDKKLMKTAKSQGVHTV